MTKEEIMDNYAIEQGYESWYDLLKCTVTIHELSQDLNKVTDLIQDELKKKIAENKHPFTQEILNTKIL